MTYARGLRLWNATPDHLADEERLAHVEGVLRMIDDPPGAITERPCFMCGVVQILMAGHKVCVDCHDDERCRICNGESERRYPALISSAAVQAQNARGGRRLRSLGRGEPAA